MCDLVDKIGINIHSPQLGQHVPSSCVEGEEVLQCWSLLQLLVLDVNQKPSVYFGINQLNNIHITPSVSTHQVQIMNLVIFFTKLIWWKKYFNLLFCLFFFVFLKIKMQNMF